MGDNTETDPRRPPPTVSAGSLRHRILDYIDQQGGELRGDSGHSLRRQICDALGERPTPVSQALIALEQRGLLEREMDLRKRRCQAIRLITRQPRPRPSGAPHRVENAAAPETSDRLAGGSAREQAELRAAEQELNHLIREAAAAARRVSHLRRALLRAKTIGSGSMA